MKLSDIKFTRCTLVVIAGVCFRHHCWLFMLPLPCVPMPDGPTETRPYGDVCGHGGTTPTSASTCPMNCSPHAAGGPDGSAAVGVALCDPSVPTPQSTETHSPAPSRVLDGWPQGPYCRPSHLCSTLSIMTVPGHPTSMPHGHNTYGQLLQPLGVLWYAYPGRFETGRLAGFRHRHGVGLLCVAPC